MEPHHFDYAIENTRIVRAPARRIETFGQTVFQFHLVSELMDSVDQVRIRGGKIHAERPELITPQMVSRLLVEGFGEQAAGYAEQLQRQMAHTALLKYGFRIRKTDLVQEIVHDAVEAVIEKVEAAVDAAGDTMSAIIHGVDDAWEVCLLKFTVDMVRGSAGGNLRDFRERGLF